MSLISFCGPCLQWKLIAAYKTVFGLKGFLGQNYYLNRTVTETYVSHLLNSLTHQFVDSTTVTSSSQVINELDNSFVNTGQTADKIQFIYSPEIAGNTNAALPAPTNIYGDTHADFVYLQDFGQFGYNRWTWDYQLSNPVTPAMLDAICDAMINGVNVDAMPADSFLPIKAAADPLGLVTDQAAFLAMNRLIPGAYNYPFTGVPGSFGFPVLNQPLKAVAISAFNPALFPNQDAGYWGFVKTVAWIKMGGLYRLQTFGLDNSGNVLSQSCITGLGDCSTWFKIAPPPLVFGQNVYEVLTPNASCP